jgi:predicted ester cyclase
MAAPAPSSTAAQVYRDFLDALNRHDLETVESRLVDVERYRENCVGFTHGFVAWAEARRSLEEVWKGIPDLRVDLEHITDDGDVALAHGTARGTATGRLYGAPATKRSYEASFFDYIRLENDRIVERVQQADVLGQMRQLYGKPLGLVAVGAMFLRQ